MKTDLKEQLFQLLDDAIEHCNPANLADAAQKMVILRHHAKGKKRALYEAMNDLLEAYYKDKTKGE